MTAEPVRRHRWFRRGYGPPEAPDEHAGEGYLDQ